MCVFEGLHTWNVRKRSSWEGTTKLERSNGVEDSLLSVPPAGRMSDVAFGGKFDFATFIFEQGFSHVIYL